MWGKGRNSPKMRKEERLKSQFCDGRRDRQGWSVTSGTFLPFAVRQERAAQSSSLLAHTNIYGKGAVGWS